MEEIVIKSGNTNCYLLKTNEGYVLIDAGISTMQENFIKRLEENGVKRGNYNYLILTHGHYDHVGNAIILRQKYNFKIAMNQGDLSIADHSKVDFPKANTSFGNMLLRLSKKEMKSIVWKSFSPDIFLEDNDNLLKMGIDAKIIHTPGHTEGSICILTATGKLYCGDLFMNMKIPQISLWANNFSQLNKSVQKILKEKFTEIAPGHGNGFTIDELNLF